MVAVFGVLVPMRGHSHYTLLLDVYRISIAHQHPHKALRGRGCGKLESDGKVDSPDEQGVQCLGERPRAVRTHGIALCELYIV